MSFVRNRKSSDSEKEAGLLPPPEEPKQSNTKRKGAVRVGKKPGVNANKLRLAFKKAQEAYCEQLIQDIETDVKALFDGHDALEEAKNLIVQGDFVGFQYTTDSRIGDAYIKAVQEQIQGKGLTCHLSTGDKGAVTFTVGTSISAESSGTESE